MEYKYLITDIQEKTKVSITSLIAFKKKHQEFFNKNSTRIQRKIYYNQAAMDFFLSYYQPEQTQEITNDYINQTTAERRGPEGEKITAETRAPEGGKNPPLEAPQTDEPPEGQLNALERKIAALEAEIGALRKQLNDKEDERKELLRQNGALILTISQLQTEKQLLLPAPKRSIGERVKGLFHKS